MLLWQHGLLLQEIKINHENKKAFQKFPANIDTPPRNHFYAYWNRYYFSYFFDR